MISKVIHRPFYVFEAMPREIHLKHLQSVDAIRITAYTPKIKIVFVNFSSN